MPGRRFGRMRKIPKYDAGATAWSYNGTNSVSEIAVNSLVNLPAGDFSWGGRFYLNSVPSGIIYWGVAGLPTWGSNSGIAFIVKGDGLYQVAVFEGGSENVGLFDTAVALQWVHLLVTYDHSATLWTLYIDGVSKDTDTAAYAGTATPVATKFGYTSLPGHYLDGKLDDWAKWDRLLTAGEIAALAAGGRALDQNSPSGPVWNMIMNKSEAATVGAFDPDGAGTLSCTNTNVTGADL